MPGAPHANAPLQRARRRRPASLPFPARVFNSTIRTRLTPPPRHRPTDSQTVRASCAPLPLRRAEGPSSRSLAAGLGPGSVQGNHEPARPEGAVRRAPLLTARAGRAGGRTAPGPRSPLAATSAGGAVLRSGHGSGPLAGKSADARHRRVEGRPGRRRAPCSQRCPARCPGAGDARLPPMPATPAGNLAPRSPQPRDCLAGLVHPRPRAPRVIAGTPRRPCLRRPAARERPPGCATRTPR